MQQPLQRHFHCKKSDEPSNKKSINARALPSSKEISNTNQADENASEPKELVTASNENNKAGSITRWLKILNKGSEDYDRPLPLMQSQDNQHSPKKVTDKPDTEVSKKTQSIIQSIRVKNKEGQALKKKPKKTNYSKETLSIIEQIKCDKTILESENKVTKESILRAPSQAIKHSDLLNNERVLVLPLQHKLLYDIICVLDDTISYFKIRHIVQSFEELRLSINTVHRRNFTIQLFAQMLTIVPEFYMYKWAKISNYKNFTMCIDIPANIETIINNIQPSKPAISYEFPFYEENTQELNQQMSLSLRDKRKEIARERLVYSTLVHHRAFLESSDYEITYDPMEQKVWHHGFNVHSVPAIECKDIRQPHYEKPLSIAEFLKENDISSDLVKKSLEIAACQSKIEVSKQSSNNTLPVEQNNHQNKTNNTYVSNELLAKVIL